MQYIETDSIHILIWQFEGVLLIIPDFLVIADIWMQGNAIFRWDCNSGKECVHNSGQKEII
jgi:hypothetical protein